MKFIHLIMVAILMLSGWGTFSLAAKSSEEGNTVQVILKGLVCDFCAQSVKKVMTKRPEVAQADINLSTKVLTLQMKPGQNLDDAAIKNLVKKAGYSIEEITR